MTNFSKNYLEKTIELWQPYCDKKFTCDDANEIAVNAVTFFELVMKWIEEDGTQEQEPEPDYCPACKGLGFIPVKVKRNIYGYESTYDEGFACPNCLAGSDKKERIGLLLYKERPVYRFINSYPFTNEKQSKCQNIKCKFDSCREEYTREIGKKFKGVKKWKIQQMKKDTKQN